MYGVELTTEERIAEALEAIAKQQDIMTTVLSNMNTRDRMMLAAVERIATTAEAQQRDLRLQLDALVGLYWNRQPPGGWEYAERQGVNAANEAAESGRWEVYQVMQFDNSAWYHMRRPREQKAATTIELSETSDLWCPSCGDPLRHQHELWACDHCSSTWKMSLVLASGQQAAPDEDDELPDEYREPRYERRSYLKG